MKNALFLLFFACSAYTLAAQTSNLTLSEFVYNEIRYVVPLGDTSWLVVADVTAEENYYNLTPHLFRLDAVGPH